MKQRRTRGKSKSKGKIQRLFAGFLAAVTMISVLPMLPANTLEVQADNQVSHVFHADAMTLQAAVDNRVTSEQEVIGDYFTFITGLTKSGKKTHTHTEYTITNTDSDFQDKAITWDNRFDTQGGAGVDKASVHFTVDENAQSAKIIILAAVKSGNTGRGVALYKSDTTAVSQLPLQEDGSTGELLVADLVPGESYYFGSNNSGIYIYYAEVIENYAATGTAINLSLTVPGLDNAYTYTGSYEGTVLTDGSLPAALAQALTEQSSITVANLANDGRTYAASVDTVNMKIILQDVTELNAPVTVAEIAYTVAGALIGIQTGSNESYDFKETGTVFGQASAAAGTKLISANSFMAVANAATAITINSGGHGIDLPNGTEFSFKAAPKTQAVITLKACKMAVLPVPCM